MSYYAMLGYHIIKTIALTSAASLVAIGIIKINEALSEDKGD